MTGIHEKPREWRVGISSTQEVLLLNLSFATYSFSQQTVSSPGQSLTCPQGNTVGKRSVLFCCLLDALPSPSKKGFLLPVDDVRYPTGDAGALKLPHLLPRVSFNNSLLMQQAVARTWWKLPQPVTTTHQPTLEISHQWSLHPFQSKALTPTLKSGHCVYKIGDGSWAMTRREHSGHSACPQFLSAHIL